jgi:hypothetical protein
MARLISKTVKSKRWFKLTVCALLLSLLVTLHVTLAPWTARITEPYREQIHDWWARRQSHGYMEALKDAEPGDLRAFIECAAAFRDHLAERKIALVVVLRPSVPVLLSENGGPQLRASERGASIFQAASALKKAKVNCFNLLPPVHEALSLKPDDAITAPDGAHFGDPVIKCMADTLGAALTPKQLASAGRNVVFASDCYALLVANVFRAGTQLPEARVLWRNSGSHLIPGEMAFLPPEELNGVRQVFWLMSDEYLKMKKYPAFPTREDMRKNSHPGERTLRVKVTRATSVPEDLGSRSPYAEALAQHEFTSEDSERFLATIDVMKGRKVALANRWLLGEPLLITVIPWQTALIARPELKNIQILDDHFHGAAQG